jgi:hypothetical protein
MAALSWTSFEALPGAATSNFETLCRSIVRRHYSQYGEFRALANQPGVEFHLRLRTKCALGEPGRWYGWQCRWYGLESGTDIGATRRQHIAKALETTKRVLPGLTDWVLCTRHPLTKRDQDWFYGLPTIMKLVLWSHMEIEDHLSGPAALLRETYFGELIVGPMELALLHEQEAAPIRRRWLPEVHQIVDAERMLHRSLGEASAWSSLTEIETELRTDIDSVQSCVGKLSSELNDKLSQSIRQAEDAHRSVSQYNEMLRRGQYDVVTQQQAADMSPKAADDTLLRQLRATRRTASLHFANMLADMRRVTLPPFLIQSELETWLR